MILYDHLWNTMELRGITQYKLIKQYGFSAGQIGRLKKNMHVSTHTLDTLCRILDCAISDIVEYLPDPADKEDAPVKAAAPVLADAAPASVSQKTDTADTAAISEAETALRPAPKAKKDGSPKAEKAKKAGKAKKDKKAKEGKKNK